MNLFDVLIDDKEEREALESRVYGVVVGLVTNIEDPEGLSRVKVKFPWLSDEDESHWARIVTPMAGKDRGLFWLPEIDDEVLLAFEHGDLRFPYILGGLWNGKDTPPEEATDGKNHVRLMKSRSGHIIRLDDEEGKEKIEIVDKNGTNRVIIDSSENTIVISADKDITLSAPQGTITLNGQKVEISSSATTKVEANGEMNLKTSATMNVKGSMVNIN